LTFFIIIKLILNDCYWHKDREISETKAIFGAFYQIIMEKKIHIKPQTGLVLEGGGMRGVFTCGVLDSFMDRGIRFPYTSKSVPEHVMDFLICPASADVPSTVTLTYWRNISISG